MKIGIESSAYFGIADAEEGIARLKKHGFQAVDYQLFVDTENELFAMSDAEFEEHLTRDGMLAAMAGIEISQTHGPWRYPPRDFTPEEREERFEKMARSLKGTRLLGCKYMVIHPIMPFGTGKQSDPQAFMDINREFFRRLCAVAEQDQVIICLENMPFPELPLSRPSEILAFVKETNSPWLRVCLDTGHCAVCGVSPADAVRELGAEYLRVMHVHDNSGVKDNHWQPYYGVIDWPEFTNALHEAGFEGVLSLECTVSAKLPADILEHHQIGLALIANSLI